MDVKESVILGEDIHAHWYYRSKARAVTRMLGNEPIHRILDVGAGSGFFSKYLLGSSDAREAICVDTGYPRASSETVHGKPIHFRPSCEFVDADLVLMMDVLEHVSDDHALLAEYVARVPAGCRFLLSVPAFQSLWSQHDDFLEHYRRYSLPQLEKLARKAQLTVKNGAYYFGLVFPIVYALRKLSSSSNSGPPRSDLRRHSSLTNGILGGLCSLELGFFRHNRLAGLSVFCLAEKPL